MRTAEDYARTERLRPGDACRFRYPARSEWLPGTVVKNGGSGYWEVRDESDREDRRGHVARGLYIEHVSAIDRRYIIRVVAPDGYTLGNDVGVRPAEEDLDAALQKVADQIREAERLQDAHGDIEREHP